MFLWNASHQLTEADSAGPGSATDIFYRYLFFYETPNIISVLLFFLPAKSELPFIFFYTDIHFHSYALSYFRILNAVCRLDLADAAECF